MGVPQETRMAESKHPEQVEYAGGKALSSKGPALHYIPTVALEKTAARFKLGVDRKGDKAWNALSNNQEVLTDRDWLIERCSHIIHHALKLRDKIHAQDIQALEADDDASAIVWGGMFLQCAVDALLKMSPSDLDVDPELDPHWEHVPAYENPGDPHPYGYKVRWSKPDAEGRYLWVGHYHAGEDGQQPTLGWCEHAAETDARRKNEEKKLPTEYPYCHRKA